MNDIEAEMDAARARVTRLAEECIRDLHARMPWGQECPLSTGATVRISGVSQPHAREHANEMLDGRWRFMFDMEDTQGRFHVEFIVFVSGWGSAA